MTSKNSTHSITRVLIAEGTRMASRLLADALSQQSSLEVVAATCGASESLLAVAERRPEVVLVSDGLEDEPRRGFELAKEIRLAAPEVRVVLLLDNCRSETVVEAFRAGARGVFSRNESLAVLSKCVACVAQGQIWANSEQMGYALEALSTAATHRHFNSDQLKNLSRREQEVAAALSDGSSNREIAERLQLSPHTVKNHVFRIFEKLGVTRRFELMAALGRRRGAHTPTRAVQRRTEMEYIHGSLLQAAQAGIASAQFVLGHMYLAGQGVSKDKVLAFKWLMQAERANQDYSEASRITRKRLAAEMLAAQIAEAERLAEEEAAEAGKGYAPVGRESTPVRMAARLS
jgi:DNA-binding NarL/FixJ family response regulator